MGILISHHSNLCRQNIHCYFLLYSQTHFQEYIWYERSVIFDSIWAEYIFVGIKTYCACGSVVWQYQNFYLYSNQHSSVAGVRASNKWMSYAVCHVLDPAKTFKIRSHCIFYQRKVAFHTRDCWPGRDVEGLQEFLQLKKKPLNAGSSLWILHGNNHGIKRRFQKKKI